MMPLKTPVTVWTSDAQAEAVGEQLLSRTLPREAWTHAAHLTATTYFMTCRPDLNVERELPGIIQAYNRASGGTETILRGYHETLTQFYMLAIRHFLSRLDPDLGLAERCNLLIASAFGERSFPLTFYSRERLFSAEAKQRFVEPDLRPLEFGNIPTGFAAGMKQIASPFPLEA